MVKQKLVYDGFEFDSRDEIKFYKWLRSLQKKGLIEGIYPHGKTYTLFEPVKREVIKVLKTKTKVEEKTLLRGANYTCDFIITFPEEWRSILFEYHDSKWLKNDPVFIANRVENMPPFCIIDVKGIIPDRYNKSDSLAKFSMTQKIMYEVHGLFVQKVVCDKLFEKTFWPYDILNRKRTKLPKNLKTVDQFVLDIIKDSKYEADQLTFI